jgi:predicted 5'-methylthioadenosine/S-adenosylhomocysteine nucleosidase
VRVLVVAALAEEVAHLPGGVDVALTGVGKARAAAGLSHRLATGARPDVVVNLGTAGAVDGSLTGVIEVDVVTQHDFPYDAIDALVGSPVDRGFALRPDAPPQPVREWAPSVTALATGDVFVNDSTAAALIAARGVRLVDMEGFGYAAACAEFGVPLRCVKAVSDGADADAGESWLDAIDGCARGLGAWLEDNVLTA